MALLGVDHIDLLKLDCVGSEFSIVEKTPSGSHIHFILGEYHGQERWNEMRARVFPGWDDGHMWATVKNRVLHRLFVVIGVLLRRAPLRCFGAREPRALNLSLSGGLR